jgi:hypothetical protein
MMLGEDVRAIDWPNYKALDLLKSGGPRIEPAGTRPRD